MKIGISGPQVSAVRFDIRYPTGKYYDCGAVFVDQKSNGRVYVITKGDGRNSDPQWRGGDVFYVDLPENATSLTFQQTGVYIPLEWATGADMTPQGDLIAVRTYGNIIMWPVLNFEGVPNALVRNGCYVNKPKEQQGEAIAFDNRGQNYLTISEGRNSPVWWFSMAAAASSVLLEGEGRSWAYDRFAPSPGYGLAVELLSNETLDSTYNEVELSGSL